MLKENEVLCSFSFVCIIRLIQTWGWVLDFFFLFSLISVIDSGHMNNATEEISK